MLQIKIGRLTHDVCPYFLILSFSTRSEKNYQQILWHTKQIEHWRVKHQPKCFFGKKKSTHCRCAIVFYTQSITQNFNESRATGVLEKCFMTFYDAWFSHCCAGNRQGRQCFVVSSQLRRDFEAI